MEHANENSTTYTPTPEEVQADQEGLAEVKDEEVRSSIVSSLGLEDNEANKGLIDKLVERDKGGRKKLSEAIGQKIKWRDTANGKSQTVKKEGEGTTTAKTTEEQITERFDDEFLDETDYSDGLKAEIKKIAKLNGTSARKATKDPYIAHLIDKETADKRNAEAANNGSGAGKENGGGGSNAGDMPAKFTDPAFMITEAGQKEYADWLTSRSNK